MRLNKKKGRALQKLQKVKSNVTVKDSEMWMMLREKYDQAITARRTFEQRWQICMAFYSGRQYTYFDSNTNTVQEVGNRKNQIRIVDNQLMPRVRRQIADSIKNNPQMSVVPATSDEIDIKAARNGDKVLKNWWRDNGMRKKNRQLQTWRYVTGNAFLDDRWNRKLGPTYFDETDTPRFMGDADVGVWSPFEIGVPAVAMGDADLHRFPWMTKSKWRPLEWISAHYKKGNQVSAEQMPANIMDSAGAFGYTTGSPTNDIEGALVTELFIQPCELHRKGAFITGANGIILQEEKYPLNYYHLEHFKDVDVPGCFWGMATMELGIGLQKGWNRTVNSIEEYNRLMAKGKYLIPRGCNLDALPDDTHGECLEYTPVYGHKPEIMNPKGLPTTVGESLGIYKTSLEDLFSQHEVTRGTNKSDIRSGDMVAMLLEQDAHGSIPSTAIYEESMEAVMSRVLKRIQKGYTQERMIKVIGSEGDYEVFSFKGADLRDNTDVHVKSESSLPDSRVAREARIIDRFERGFYGNPQDPRVQEKLQNAIDDANAKELHADARQDRQNARVENQVLIQPNSKLAPNDYDLHEIHVAEHIKFLKSPEMQKLKLKKPQMYQTLLIQFQQHLQVHQNFVKEAQQRAMAMQAKMEQMKGKSSGPTR